MSWLQCKSYLFPKNIRITYLAGSLIGVGGLVAFSSFMWYLSTIPANDQHACGMVACVFTLLAGWCASAALSNLKIINMRYEIVNDVAINYYGKNSIRINLNSGILKEELALPLKVIKSNYYIDYVLIANNANKVIPGDTKRGIRVLLNFWKSGVVVLPKVY